MSKLNLSKIKLFAALLIFAAFIAIPKTQAFTVQRQAFTPPPIPVVNTPEFKNFVRQFHTFPSPFGYEPYRDKNGKERLFLLKDLNPIDTYIPVTFYCNHTICPSFVAFSNDSLMFKYADGDNILLIDYGKYLPQSFVGFYSPDDPRLFTALGVRDTSKIRKGDPIATVLFSQLMLQSMTQDEKLKSFFSTKGKNKSLDTFSINLPLSDGQESVSVGTTLSLMGLGEASGVEFTETVSQTTGESYSTQVQTGFNLSVNFENNFMLGGGLVPASDSVKTSVNATLSHMISNGLQIANQQTVSRTYLIKPGINDTYYWAIYQLGYSYRLNAPLLDAVLDRAQAIWGNYISYKIGENGYSQDNKPLGIILPPQAPNHPSDVSVGVAVPINPGNQNFYSEILPLRKSEPSG